MSKTFEQEIKRIMGDKYYEGAGTDFTAENIIDLFKKHEAQVREEVEGLSKEENEFVIDIRELSDLYNKTIDDVLKLLSQPKKEQEDN